jgi:hypothetical protein
MVRVEWELADPVHRLAIAALVANAKNARAGAISSPVTDLARLPVKPLE